MTEDDLEKIAALAYLNLDSSSQLKQDISAMMDWIEQLRSVDTTNITPQTHPLNLTQPLRKDEAQSTSYTAELEKIAPLFVDNLYLVPNVIQKEEE